MKVSGSYAIAFQAMMKIELKSAQPDARRDFISFICQHRLEKDVVETEYRRYQHLANNDLLSGEILQSLEMQKNLLCPEFRKQLYVHHGHATPETRMLALTELPDAIFIPEDERRTLANNIELAIKKIKVPHFVELGTPTKHRAHGSITASHAPQGTWPLKESPATKLGRIHIYEEQEANNPACDPEHLKVIQSKWSRRHPFDPQSIIATGVARQRADTGNMARIVYLKTDDAKGGYLHILEAHGEDFWARGVLPAQIPGLLIRALAQGEHVGDQGWTNHIRPIYRTTTEAGLPIDVGISYDPADGYIIGANPT
ncbi:hypothetical protein QTI27_35655 [Variovorax sp. J31P216]|nr:hypothetical protein [Variovorax sp. J31P216]